MGNGRVHEKEGWRMTVMITSGDTSSRRNKGQKVNWSEGSSDSLLMYLVVLELCSLWKSTKNTCLM